MLIDFYAVYLRDPGKKTKWVLEAFSGSYAELQRPGKRDNLIPLYLTSVPECVQAHSSRKPALTLSGAGGAYFTGLFIPDPTRPDLAFGDMGEDALLFLRQGDKVELLIAKGKKAVAPQLFSMLSDGDPDLLAEIAEHRKRAAKPKPL